MVDSISSFDRQNYQYSSANIFAQSTLSDDNSVFTGQSSYALNPGLQFGVFDANHILNVLLGEEEVDFFEIMINNMIANSMQYASNNLTPQPKNIFSQNYGYNQYNANKTYNTTTDLMKLKSVYNPSVGLSLANVAKQNAWSIGTVGWCLKGVRTTLNKAGLDSSVSMGSSAYQATQILDKNKAFAKIDVARQDLTTLPAGCVVVWGNSAAKPHGHISITLGNGKEASDHIQNLNQRNENHTVYVPVGKNC